MLPENYSIYLRGFSEEHKIRNLCFQGGDLENCGQHMERMEFVEIKKT
jgi:hypothetical protein